MSANSLLLHQILKVDSQVGNVVFVLVDLPIRRIGEKQFEALAVLVTSGHVLRAVRVGGVQDVEEDAVIPTGALPVVTEPPDDELLAAPAEQRALDVVLEVGKVPHKLQTLLRGNSDPYHGLQEEEKCHAVHSWSDKSNQLRDI